MKTPIILKIQHLLNQSLSPVQIAMFFNDNEYRPYHCIFSNSNSYHHNKNYDLYQLAPLLRTICKKSEILSNDLYKHLFNNEYSNHLCYMLNWEDFNRKIIIFDLNQTTVFDNKLFIKIMSENTKDLLDIFNIQLEEQKDLVP